MKIFNHSTCKVFLCTSFILNLLLIGVIYIAETHSRVFSMALERRNLLTLNDKVHPDYWVIAGWTNTIKKLHNNFDAAFFGNSITCGSDFQSFFPEKKIINLGYPGDNIKGMQRRVPMLQASHPQKIFIMAGTNDLFHSSINEFVSNYNTLLSVITDSIPNAKIYLESILPMNQDMKKGAPSDETIRQANTEIEKKAKSRKLEYIDVYSQYAKNGKLPSDITRDGIHLLPQHYDKWASLVESFINE